MAIDLLYLTRDHDLPPKWDGHPVTWRGWRDPLSGAFVCGRGARDRHVCTACGSTAAPVVNTGRVAGVMRWRLDAYRCPDCKTDQVCDWAGVWWDLGPEDCGDDGSRALW